MAYFWESATMQSRINNLTHLTWTNNRTRLNASNLNQLSNSVRVLSEVLCDKGNSNGGLIQQFDAVRQLVQGDSAPDYSTKDQYKQLDVINRSLYGYRSQHHYQIGDDENDNSANVLSYFRINEQAAGNDAADNVSGVLGKVYWKYINQDKPFVDDYQRFRNIFKAGYSINDAGEHTEFSTTPIANKRYGITKTDNEVLTPFYIDWSTGIIFNDNVKVDGAGNIIPIGIYTNEQNEQVRTSLGNEEHKFEYGWFTNLNSTNNTFENLKPAQEDGSYIGTQLIPYQNLYLRNGHIEFLNSKNINVVSVLPITLNGTLQESNIGGNLQRHEWGYFNNLKVTNQGADSDSVVILGTQPEGGIDLGNNPTLYNAASQMFGDNADYLLNESESNWMSGKNIHDKTTSAVINYAGRKISDIDNSLNFFAEDPTVDSPTITATLDTNSIEVGTKFKQIKLKTTTFTPGQYTYGCVDMENNDIKLTSDGYYQYLDAPATGLDSNSYTYIFEGSIIDADNSENNKTLVSENDILSVPPNELGEAEFIFDDSDKLDVVVKVTHPAGNIPVDSIGRTVDSKRILASPNEGTFLQWTKTITSYRKPFWGWKLSSDLLDNPESITSEQVRALGYSGTSVNDVPNKLTNIPSGTKQLYFLVKSGIKKSLTITNNTKQPSTSVACTKVTGIQVADNRGTNSDGTLNNPEYYDMWYVDLANPFSETTKLTLAWT